MIYERRSWDLVFLRKKKSAIITVSVVTLVVFLFLSILTFSQKAGASLTTDTISTVFSTQEEKLNFLRKYLVLPSMVSSTEFHIVFQDNSKGWVPGPSD
ncbi:MAG: hypothetical protein VR66_05060 [Peptococcaceae bacterium BRH_c23]|nr:MAG: hypothetical protein VR66_05060 [Peptococcaceae bacterium BRH_c23]KJS86369.1 MAG: hypothetical protein JL57_16650 [Desulfosporosinus sp. BICA1-9]HBW35621.1 hypothetical protein [Desulfosporosinus sp.]